MAQPAANRQLRTRKDLLRAATRLLNAGKTLNMDVIAKEALVSRATAYRYFSDIDELMGEVVIDSSMPDPKEVFRNHRADGIAERLDHAESIVHDFVYKNEPQLRLLISRSVTKSKTPKTPLTIPGRQNRRTEYIAEALAPYLAEFDKKTLKKLTEALALVFGPEAMIVYRDVVPLDPQRARDVKRWIVTTLANAAMLESRKLQKRR